MRALKLLGAAAILSAATPLAASPYAHAQLEPSGRIIADIEGDDRPGALYEAGSIGKFACTLAALRLADRGAFALDDTLGELLPEMATTSIAQITLAQVLASRSGISDGLLPAFQADPAAVMATPDARSAVQKFTLGALSAEPGEKWSYDLVNWVVAQAVIERATGQPITAVLHKLVLAPAGMGNSRVFVGEIGDGAQPPMEPVRPLPGFLTCAGGLATTPSDLLALARFPHKGGLSAASLKALTSVTTPEEDYTLGGRFTIIKDRGQISWQTGSNGAYKSLVAYDPATDTGFAAMTASGSNAEIQSARGRWLAKPDENGE